MDLVPNNLLEVGFIDNLHIWVQMREAKDKLPNSFYLPGNPYDDKDFRLYTSDGRELKYVAPIRVIGIVDTVWEYHGDTYVKICPKTIESLE